jgi:succinate dehydrogenase (ubiquinone) cytochrome b560 subunit
MYAIVPIDSAAVATSLHTLPLPVLFFGKLLVGAPLFFHSFNGLRHLLWDTGNALTLGGVYKTGYAVLGLTGLTTFIYALY